MASATPAKGPRRGKPSQEPRDVVDDTPFPVPSLYFHEFDSEKDEPESKVRQDVLKLYEHWQEKHGRRWPENGLLTEDLVWLAEEAYKPDGRGGKRKDLWNTRGSKGPDRAWPPSGATVAVENSEVTDHMHDSVTEEADAEADAVFASAAAAKDGAAAGKAAARRGGKGARGAAATSGAAAGAAGRAARRPRLSNFEKTVAGGKWVTDEFESEQYEAGNMEQLWDMYLWDREGKPTIMPEEAPNPQEGEESEAWDDFYTSYRPRHIDSETARAAVWVTDEFESDEDNTESEWEPEYVGAGLGLKTEDKFNPQYSLRHSCHPLAPFPGEALRWNSFMYDDGTSYEGLTREDIFHGMGVMTFGNGTGAGFHFKDVRRGDKYEGEFQGGYAHGLGQFTSEARGEVYIGEFFASQRHGCGLKVNMKPYYYLLERGEQPAEAYQKTYDHMMRNIEFRTWYRNRPLGSDYEDELVLHPIMEDLGSPWDVVINNTKHENKLREWKGKTVEEKAYTKLADIVGKVAKDRSSRREAALGTGNGDKGYFYRGDDGKLHTRMDSCGEDTEHDSIDLLLGRETDGMPGPGWRDDPAADSDADMLWDPKLIELAANEAMDDKMEEDDDKENVLGDDIVNPFTGLTMKDYLDGREQKHREFIVKQFGHQEQFAGYATQYGIDPGSDGLEPEGGARRRGGGGGRRTGGFLSRVGRLFGIGKGPDLIPGMSAYDAHLLNKSLERAAEMDKEDDPYLRQNRYHDPKRNPASDDTDTRFETESDQMELCDLAEILGTVDEAEGIVTRARQWRWKPAGEVTLRAAQDANGAPVELMQDPLHYPHGTKFMAPGPLGQCHPLPDDAAIRDAMLKVANNYEHVHSMYNFDWDPEPGSVQYAINQRIERMEELRAQQLGRMDQLADEVAEEEARMRGGGGELLASLDGLSAAGSSASGGGKQLMVQRNGTVFASMSLGMSHAARAVWDSLARAAHNSRAMPPLRRRAAAATSPARRRAVSGAGSE